MGPPAQWEMQDLGPEGGRRGGRAAAPLPAGRRWGRQAVPGYRTPDDEAAHTDDTSSHPLSQLHHLLPERSGASRKKSIPLSIKNLKRKHKRKEE